jgi:protein SCO1/2
MKTTRPLRLARQGALAVALVAIVTGCASGSVRTAPTATPSATASAAATDPVEPSLAPPSVVPSVAPVAPSVAPATAEPATPAPSVAASDPGTAVATERPGPTPIAGEVKPAPEFVDLVRADGTPFTLADERGRTTLLFFGYTHCPDVCPATIGELMQVLQARPDVRVVFVTVDPERDTPEFLAEWTKYLPEGMVGVTGSPLAIRHAADQYGVRYARVDTDSRSGYAMSHTAFQYLIDAEGNLVLTYPFGTPAAAIIGDLDAMGLGA